MCPLTGPAPICPPCNRPIPPGARASLNHLIPRLRGGKGRPTVLLHQICHNEIHATLTEAELARDACVFVNTGMGKAMRLRDIYARVVRDGRVSVGDLVCKLA